MSENYRSGWSYIGEGLGLALIILSICLGIGGCLYLTAKESAERQPSENISQVHTNK